MADKSVFLQICTGVWWSGAVVGGLGVLITIWGIIMICLRYREILY